jgi:hypothetical protein
MTFTDTTTARRNSLRGALAALVLAAGLAVWPVTPLARTFDPKTASFSIAFEDEVSSYTETSVFVMPGSTLSLAIASGPAGEYTTQTDDGVLVRKGVRRWQWTAPEKPGMYKLTITGPTETDNDIDLRAFVMVPAGKITKGYLNGYRIGSYPDAPLNGNPVYRPPPGFIEVTHDNEDTQLSPHFRLKQFICKQEPLQAYPKYVVLEERLILHLEAILERVNALGFDADTLHVMSGYRTPHYNAVLRDARYSMHQFGGAADIFVDEHDKNVMDDLTHDGRVDVQDARALYDLVESMVVRAPFKKFEGGLGFYPATPAHPPFVHVDVRGSRARWKG